MFQCHRLPVSCPGVVGYPRPSQTPWWTRYEIELISLHMFILVGPNGNVVLGSSIMTPRANDMIVSCMRMRWICKTRCIDQTGTKQDAGAESSMEEAVELVTRAESISRRYLTRHGSLTPFLLPPSAQPRAESHACHPSLLSGNDSCILHSSLRADFLMS